MSAEEIEVKYQDRFADLIEEILECGDDPDAALEAAAMSCARGLLSLCTAACGDQIKALEGASAAINSMHARQSRNPS